MTRFAFNSTKAPFTTEIMVLSYCPHQTIFQILLNPNIVKCTFQSVKLKIKRKRKQLICY